MRMIYTSLTWYARLTYWLGTFWQRFWFYFDGWVVTVPCHTFLPGILSHNRLTTAGFQLVLASFLWMFATSIYLWIASTEGLSYPSLCSDWKEKTPKNHQLIASIMHLSSRLCFQKCYLGFWSLWYFLWLSIHWKLNALTWMPNELIFHKTKLAFWKTISGCFFVSGSTLFYPSAQTQHLASFQKFQWAFEVAGHGLCGHSVLPSFNFGK